ncbi:MAG: OmpA family protein [Nitrospirota bacterium]|nr:OmpA family protein [Nitrospirota bacterium]
MKNQLSGFCIAAILCLITLTHHAVAQESTAQAAVYFETAKSALTRQAKAELQRLVSDAGSECTLRIYGNTDSRGSDEYNMDLARQRGESVREFLLSCGLPENAISIEAYGEAKPVASNETDSGKKLNRRVDVLIDCAQEREVLTAASEVSENPMEEDGADDLQKLMALLATPPQLFSINPKKDTALTCNEGTILYFKVNCMSLPSAHVGNVDIAVRENYSKSSMICDNLATQAGSGLLVSDGMVEVVASDKTGNTIKMKSKDGLVAFIPTMDVDPKMDVFDGKRHGKRKTATWKQRSSSNITPFSYSNIMDCSDYWRYRKNRCNFWCRTKTMFTTSPIKRTRIRGGSATRKTRCEVRRSLVKKYGTSNYDAILDAMNRDVYKAMGVKNQDEYLAALKAQQDSLKKWRKEDVEGKLDDGSVSKDDLQYYVFSNSNFGYYNCDAFETYPAREVIAVTIPNKDGRATYMSMVFNDKNMVISPDYRGSSFYFKKVKEDAEVVVVAIRSYKGQPQLAMQTTRVNKKMPELIFEDVSVEMLKEKLQMLNSPYSDTALR